MITNNLLPCVSCGNAQETTMSLNYYWGPNSWYKYSDNDIINNYIYNKNLPPLPLYHNLALSNNDNNRVIKYKHNKILPPPPKYNPPIPLNKSK